MSESARQRFPFSAIIGQDKLKMAYLANVVNPRIGGLLISGPKGTGKSTAVHSIESALPDITMVEGCPFGCDPGNPSRYCSLCREKRDHAPVKKRMAIVNLPLSCTEDRLIGSIDIEKLLKTGEKAVLPGILGAANGNILYVDEVNLLPDHLVDDILDAAASHWNTIEREGVSIAHPAEFVLAGTMNPEEGDLRPQILDRFPLCVKIETVRDPAQRVAIVRLNLEYENDPATFFAKFADQEEKLKGTIVAARALLPQVSAGDEAVAAVARSCAELKVDGQRPDIVIVKTALTLAALAGRTQMAREDIMLASELALVHRTRDGGLLEPPTAAEIGQMFAKHAAAVPTAKMLKPQFEGEAQPGQAQSAPAGSDLNIKKNGG
jgi:Mg-chelatase subunit ChlI